MYSSVLVFFLTTVVNAEMRSVQQGVYVSRKSRSYSTPIETGYVYNQVNSHPGTMAVYSNDLSDYNSHATGAKSGDFPMNFEKKSDYRSENLTPLGLHTEIPMTTYDIDYEKAKAEAKYDSHYIPAKMKADSMYDRPKSVMHYKYPDNSMMGDINYEYHVDDDDVRSSSRSSYDSWPYLYRSNFEYEPAKVEDSSDAKVKDKRYVSGIVKELIPVHEQVDDYPNTYDTVMTTFRYSHPPTTDNPVLGDQPFLSYILSDYYDKHTDDDHMNFKGLEYDWGKDFDHEPIDIVEKDDFKRYPRYDAKDKPAYNDDYIKGLTKYNNRYDMSKSAAGESSTEKEYEKKHEFDKHEDADAQKENHNAAYAQSGHHYRGNKDFIDTFGNKFGGEDNKKHSKYLIKTNQDKGEKRKGFRRVYHKDEFQEDNEFYDNTNKKVNAEESGNSAYHNGGSEAILQSHAAAAVGEETSAFSKNGNADRKNMAKNHRGHNHNKGYDNELLKYRDVAKLAAKANGADYK